MVPPALRYTRTSVSLWDGASCSEGGWDTAKLCAAQGSAISQLDVDSLPQFGHSAKHIAQVERRPFKPRALPPAVSVLDLWDRRLKNFAIPIDLPTMGSGIFPFVRLEEGLRR